MVRGGRGGGRGEDAGSDVASHFYPACPKVVAVVKGAVLSGGYKQGQGALIFQGLKFFPLDA